MRLSMPLLTVLGIQLMQRTVLAETAFAYCSCIDTGNNNAVDAGATQYACDQIDHSDYYSGTEGAESCHATESYGILNSCFNCMCQWFNRHSSCGDKDTVATKIRCGSGC
jgi:hypothetical protein